MRLPLFFGRLLLHQNPSHVLNVLYAQARIAARRSDQVEAQKHVAAAKAILDKGTIPEQAQFFPYLKGYVAFYAGDYKAALEGLKQANQNDPFIQCMIGQTYEKLVRREAKSLGLLAQSFNGSFAQSCHEARTRLANMADIHSTAPLSPERTLRVALYARVSTKDKGQEVENQLAQLREFAARSGWMIVHEYIDHETGKSSDREQFEQMFQDASQRKFDVLLFWALDRLSREGVRATLRHLERLTSCGVGYRSFTEQISIAAASFVRR